MGAVKKPLLLLAAVLAVVVASSAYAITYGRYDGNGHPNVGAMLRLSPTSGNYRIVCTGSLISPTVYLTEPLHVVHPEPADRLSGCLGYVRSDVQLELHASRERDPRDDVHESALQPARV